MRMTLVVIGALRVLKNVVRRLCKYHSLTFFYYRMFVQPLYCGVLFDQCMLLNRRKDDAEDMKGVDEKVSFYMCVRCGSFCERKVSTFIIKLSRTILILTILTSSMCTGLKRT